MVVASTRRKRSIDLQVLGRAAELLLRREVGGLDDQRVAFPAADRIAHPRPDVLRQVLAADADDARVVDHLHQDHHVIRRLHDLEVVVVEVIRHERRGRPERQQAALGERPELGVIVLAAAAITSWRALLAARARLGGQRRNAAVRADR